MESLDDHAEATLGAGAGRRRTYQMILETVLDYADHDLPRLLLEYWDEMEQMGESTLPLSVESVLDEVLGGESEQVVQADAHWIGATHGRSWYFDKSMRIFYMDEGDVVPKPHLTNPRRFVETVNPFGCQLDLGPSGRAEPRYAGVGGGWLDEWSGKTPQDVRWALDDCYTRLLRGRPEEA
jgi:hypothetical protein